MGLLDQDQWSAVGNIGIGLLNRNFGAGAAAAMQGLDAAKMRKLQEQHLLAQNGLLGAQLNETNAQAEERKAKVADMQKTQQLMDSTFGPQGVSAPFVSPGAFQGSPSQAGPMGPTMPPSMAGLSAPGSRLANLTFDQLAALKGAGKDFTELHKYANDPLKLESGSTYRNRVTGKEEYMPKLPEGMAPSGPGGPYGFVPGYQESIVGLEGAKAGAVEGAKAGQDLIQVPSPKGDGSTVWVTRAQAVQAAQPPRPAVAPRPGFPAPRQPAQQSQSPSSLDGDPQVVMAAINDIKDPAERAAVLAQYQRQYGPLQASPTTAQTTSAAADKEMAVQGARDVAEQRKGIMNAGFVAPSNIARYQHIGKLLQDVDGGKLTPMGTEFASALNGLGLKIDKNLPNKEAAASMANAAALELRSPAGGAGMPGALSDADRQFLSSMTPNMSQSADGRRMVIGAYVAVQQRNQQVSQFARNYERKYGKLDNGFFDQMQAWSAANPLFKAK